MKHLYYIAFTTLLACWGIHVRVQAQTGPYENLLEHRSGFGENVTGGTGGELVVLNSNDFEAFAAAVEGSSPRWVRFEPGVYEIKLNRVVKPGSDLTIDGRGANVTFTYLDTRWEFSFVNVHNIIIHNVSFKEIGFLDDPEVEAGRGLNFYNGTHDIWIDHCTFSRIGDESVAFGYDESFNPAPDTGTGANATISFCWWYDTRKAMLLGWHCDNSGYDHDLTLTVHHCYFNGPSRIPNQRGGKCHLYNNVIEDWGWSAAENNNGAQLRIENCWYQPGGNRDAMKNFAYGCMGSGWICETGNVLNGSNKVGPGFNCDQVFQPTDYYTYVLEDPDSVLIDYVKAKAGRQPRPSWDSSPVKTFRLTTEIVSGKGSVVPDEGVYAEGEQVSLRAIPELGYAFSEWGGDYSGSENPVNIRIDTSVHITVSFTEVPTYTLSTSTDGHGRISPDSGTFSMGDEITITAFPDLGYLFNHWEGDLSGSENPVTMVMDTDKMVTAVFLSHDPLQAYWPMDENSGSILTDSTGNGNDASLSKDDGSQYITGISGVALYLDGNRDAKVTAADLLTPESVTVAAYVKVDIGVSQWRWVAGHGDNYGLVVNRFDQGGFFFYYYNGSSWPGLNADNQDIRDGEWHHIAGGYDASDGTMSLFLDGVQVKSGPGDGPIKYNIGNDFHIGSMMSARYFKGAIDELRVYDQPLNEEALQSLLVTNTAVPNKKGAFSSGGFFPNPFADQTVMLYRLDRSDHVRLKIYNSSGKLVRMYDQGMQKQGMHRLVWNGTDDKGNRLPTGLYFYRLRTEKESEGGKIIIL